MASFLIGDCTHRGTSPAPKNEVPYKLVCQRKGFHVEVFGFYTWELVEKHYRGLDAAYVVKQIHQLDTFGTHLICTNREVFACVIDEGKPLIVDYVNS